VGVAESLLQQSVYVYQFKINMKAAFEGASWPWHQDFAFCHLEDGMPSPRAVNIAIHLDEVTPENGPLLLIPGSHRLGLLDVRKGAEGGDWRQHVSADLDYTVKDGTVSRLTDELGVTTIIGSQGYSFAFHPSILHASSANTSSERRALLIVTYNAVDNAPSDPSRPEFLVSRDTDAIIPLSI
jgi:ectoine hydroxylase